MVFLGIVMMPFYYGAKVRSVPEYLRLRFGNFAHAWNAGSFAVATVLISGVNLFALALVVHLMLGWSIAFSILVAARDRDGLHQPRRADLGDLQRGAAVLHHRRQPGAAGDRLAARHGRDPRPGEPDQAHEARRRRAARLAGARHRPRHQPDRRQLAGDGARARLRALVRLLDDELRRGAAGAVGQEPLGRPPHAADRRVPEDLHPRADDHPRARRARHRQGPRRQLAEPPVQRRDPAAGRAGTCPRGCSASPSPG